MIIYIFLDTNIYIRIVSQGMPGCPMEQFVALKTLVEGGAVQLLVPEVVLLELEKEQGTFEDQLNRHCDLLKASVEKLAVWTEARDIKESLLDHLDERRQVKLQTASNNFKEIGAWLASDKARILDLTPEIWFQAKRRIMAGRYPKGQGKADQDCSIMESLISFFKGVPATEAELYFCSENHPDFAIEREAKGKSRTFDIHPYFQDGLPRTTYFLDLDTLMAFAGGYEQLVPPKSRARTASETTVSKGLTEWFPTLGPVGENTSTQTNVPLHSEAVIFVAPRYDPQIVERFQTEMLPNLSPAVQELRATLVKEIQEILAACRRCAIWDVGSEVRLIEWLDFISEKMVPYVSLSRLVTIKGNLERYLQAHREMDAKQDKEVPREESTEAGEPESDPGPG
jgi:hypothetical protein